MLWAKPGPVWLERIPPVGFLTIVGAFEVVDENEDVVVVVVVVGGGNEETEAEEAGKFVFPNVVVLLPPKVLFPNVLLLFHVNPPSFVSNK
jgi:hypothetical protein